MITKKDIEQLILDKDYDELIRIANQDKSSHSKVLRFTQRNLFAGFHEPIKWYAATALGELARNFSDENEEVYLNLLRRFVWALNDESISVPWGISEGMGAVIANNVEKLGHFTTYLITYSLDSYICFPGMLWSLGKIVEKDKALVEPFMDKLIPFLDSDNLDVLTYAILFMEKAEQTDQIDKLKTLEDNEEVVTAFIDGDLTETTIGDLARKAVKTLSK